MKNGLVDKMDIVMDVVFDKAFATDGKEIVVKDSYFDVNVRLKA